MLKYQSRSAFTLVEIIAVIAIITLLAGLVVGASVTAVGIAREARTRSLVKKIDSQIRTHWESYSERRMGVDVSATAIKLYGSPTYKQIDVIRIEVLRELQRLELPDRWTDVLHPPCLLAADKPGISNPVTAYQQYISNNFSGSLDYYRPSASQAYLFRLRSHMRTHPDWNHETDRFQGAECLYLIMTVGLGAEGLKASQLAKGSVGDADEDGLLEFRDGWGNPISFVRWPAGFVSAKQPIQFDDDGNPFRIRSSQGNPTIASFDFSPIDSPLDRLRSDFWPDEPGSRPARGYALYPLVYSAGSDGMYGIVQAIENVADDDRSLFLIPDNDPYVFNDQATAWYRMQEPVGTVQVFQQLGSPDGDAWEPYLDNIHNHQIYAQ